MRASGPIKAVPISVSSCALDNFRSWKSAQYKDTKKGSGSQENKSQSPRSVCPSQQLWLEIRSGRRADATVWAGLFRPGARPLGARNDVLEGGQMRSRVWRGKETRARSECQEKRSRRKGGQRKGGGQVNIKMMPDKGWCMFLAPCAGVCRSPTVVTSTKWR